MRVAYEATVRGSVWNSERVLPLTDDAFPVLPRSHFSPHKEARLRELVRYLARELRRFEFDKQRSFRHVTG